MPALLEFKRDKVEDQAATKLRNATRTVPMNVKLSDKNGVEFGRKFLLTLTCVFSLQQICVDGLPHLECVSIQAGKCENRPRILHARRL